MKRINSKFNVSRFESACCNLNTARDDWMEAVHYTLNDNLPRAIQNLDECIRQLESARYKLHRITASRRSRARSRRSC